MLSAKFQLTWIVSGLLVTMKLAFNYQICFIKLECTWELFEKLIDTVQPLEKHWRSFIGVLWVHTITTPICKLVAKFQPLPLYQHLKALGKINNHVIFQLKKIFFTNLFDIKITKGRTFTFPKQNSLYYHMQNRNFVILPSYHKWNIKFQKTTNFCYKLHEEVLKCTNSFTPDFYTDNGSLRLIRVYRTVDKLTPKSALLFN